MKVRRKTAVADAVQAVKGRISLIPGVTRDNDHRRWTIRTADHWGPEEVHPGDWIVTYPGGDRYLYKPDTFEDIFERINPMPWTPRDAYSHTKKASTPTTQRQWSHVANSVLQSSGDEARAIREANAAVAREPRPSRRKKPTK